MSNRTRSTVMRQGQLLLSGLALLVTVVANLAGEKIQITGPETIAPPGFKEDIFTNPSDFLRSKPDSGSAPILAPPSPSITIRPDKLQDDKKWDLNEKFDEEGMLKRALGVREYNLDSLAKKQKGNWEKLYAETAERKGQLPKRFTEEGLNRDDNDWELLRRFAANRGEKRTDEDSSASTPITELNFFNLLFGNELGDNFALIAGGVVRGPFLPNANNNPWNRPPGAPQGDRGQEQKIRSKQFDTLFDSKKLLVNQPSDPINGRSDDARREMNPVTGRKLDDYSSGNGNSKPAEPFGTANSMRSALSGPLDSLSSRVSGVSSLAPSATPIPPPSIGPSPAPFSQEIPRRKF